MDIYTLLSLLGGLAFFLFGMTIMSNSLKIVAGDRLEVMLKKLTSNPMTGIAVGAGITIAMQSSSALTVMLVGLVNSGIMELSQTVGLIMGSNIGTTLTAWILGLSGLESGMPLINLLKPDNLAPIVAVIGIIMMMTAKGGRNKEVGTILIGFALLMSGMRQMSDSMAPLADSPEFMKLLISFENPVMGVIIGTLFTGVIQSSAASVGILQALSITGQVSYAMAIPIVMGQNIGTCVTSLLSSIGVSKNAKRVAVIHISFNLIGTALGLSVFFICRYILALTFFDEVITPFMVAGVHTVFNVATTIVLLPFSDRLVRFAAGRFGDDEDDKTEFLDERLLNTPSLAIDECAKKIRQILTEVVSICSSSMGMIYGYDSKLYEDNESLIADNEIKIAACENFLGKLYKTPVSYNGEPISSLLYNVGDISRILNYAKDIQKLSQKIERNKVTLNKKQKKALLLMREEYVDYLENAKNSYLNRDPMELDETIRATDLMIGRIKKLRKNLFKREKDYDSQSRLYFSELLFDCKNISWHISNLIESITGNEVR